MEIVVMPLSLALAAASALAQQTAPRRLLDEGFVFRYPTLAQALGEIRHWSGPS